MEQPPTLVHLEVHVKNNNVCIISMGSFTIDANTVDELQVPVRVDPNTLKVLKQVLTSNPKLGDKQRILENNTTINVNSPSTTRSHLDRNQKLLFYLHSFFARLIPGVWLLQLLQKIRSSTRIYHKSTKKGTECEPSVLSFRLERTEGSVASPEKGRMQRGC